MRDKLIFDLFKDVENYDHSLPLALLLVEYSINNIPFTWLHWLSIITLQVGYVLFQWWYSVNVIHKPVYNSIDWQNDPQGSLLKSMFPVVTSFLFAIITINVTNCKVKIASGVNCSKDL